jgi:hypothetical protein
VREAMTVTCICLIACSFSSALTMNIAIVLHERVNKRQFGGKRAFFLEIDPSFCQLCQDQCGISLKGCAEGRTSIIGNKVGLQN